MDTIENLRQEIDQIHQQMHALLERRRDLTVRIWAIKKTQGQPFFNAEREAQIIKDFTALSESQKDPAFDKLLAGVMNSVLREYETYLKSKFKT